MISLSLRACVNLYGWELHVQEEDLKQFRQLKSRTPGHPENFETPGIEVTTGNLSLLYMHVPF